MVKTLQVLDPARIGEINLLLDALSQRARRRDLAHRVISGMAARCDHLLQPELYVTIGKELKLVTEEAGDGLAENDKKAARWLYEQGMKWFEQYAREFATDEGAAKTRHVSRVRRKLGAILM